MRNAVRYIYNRRHCCATARWKSLLFLLFARLIGNAARGLAGALAGSLALAAAALGAVEFTGRQGFDFHGTLPLFPSVQRYFNACDVFRQYEDGFCVLPARHAILVGQIILWRQGLRAAKKSWSSRPASSSSTPPITSARLLKRLSMGRA